MTGVHKALLSDKFSAALQICRRARRYANKKMNIEIKTAIIAATSVISGVIIAQGTTLFFVKSCLGFQIQRRHDSAPNTYRGSTAFPVEITLLLAMSEPETSRE